MANLNEALLQLTVARSRESVRELDDATILMALENENACNPVLRTSANAMIEEVTA